MNKCLLPKYRRAGKYSKAYDEARSLAHQLTKSFTIKKQVTLREYIKEREIRKSFREILKPSKFPLTYITNKKAKLPKDYIKSEDIWFDNLDKSIFDRKAIEEQIKEITLEEGNTYKLLTIQEFNKFIKK